MFDYIVRHRYVQEIQACKFFHQIIDGVEALHRSDITHRDLKPENLLLNQVNSPEGGLVVKIVDFGLSNTHEVNVLQ
jgi:serine/threonine protein kinase